MIYVLYCSNNIDTIIYDDSTVGKARKLNCIGFSSYSHTERETRTDRGFPNRNRSVSEWRRPQKLLPK